MASIELRPDGPLAVSGEYELKHSDGQPVVHREVVAKLCRCGGSQNKPFCDGTHRRNGFSGARAADGSADKVDAYVGSGITIHDNRSVCAHAGKCTDGLPAVFKYGSEPWIDPNGGLSQTAMEIVRHCPSGALSYSIDGVAPTAEQWPASIEVTKDGPYAVLGMELQGVPFAQGVPTQRYTLCRCGASKNKPFCDGSHYEVGFKG
ncbi:MAG TPA: CDGSH iron-sulfur domain-containing protein [Usitatibacter sp.]|nr:CDGSH iron-sulfur domain-containing protein [Usitatibacter sp.]